jgi:2-keto-4-pentenoate hydratase
MNVTKVEKAEKLAQHLAQAEKQGRGVSPLTELDPDLTLEEAYEVQLVTINHKVKSGQKIVGKKSA